jgi:GNAT superfamily N-acetyltransferase
MKHPVSIRAATPSDSDAVAAIFLGAHRTSMRYLPESHSDEEVVAWFTGTVLAEEEVFAAEAGGAIVGFLALLGEVLEHLYVRPDVQRRGVGSALLAHAKELRPDGFRLWVFQRNAPARRFYEARGLRLVELTDGSANEEHEPDALYEWRPTGR